MNAKLHLVLVPLAIALAPVQSANAAAFLTNSPLATERYFHTATLLPTGKVLVSGGATGLGPLIV